MLEPGDRVLVAVSGGPDSMALLSFLHDLAPELQLSLHVFHLNHQIRAAAKEEAKFVEQLALNLDIPVTVRAFDVAAYAKKNKLSLELGARKIRYRMYQDIAGEVGAGKVALGHQADDQVETFLWRLLRGSGLTGLAAIPAVRGIYIRPLIEVSRLEIEDYLKERNIPYCADLSNQDLAFTRNRIRHALLPVLEDFNMAVKDVILNTVELARRDEAYLEQVAGRHWDELAEVCRDEVRLPLKAMQSLAPSILSRLIRRAVAVVKGDLEQLEFRHIKRVEEAVAAGEVWRMDLPGGVVARVRYDSLTVFRQESAERHPFQSVQLGIPGTTIIPALGLTFCAEVRHAGEAPSLDQPSTGATYSEAMTRSQRAGAAAKSTLEALLDADKITEPVQIRTRVPGDRFRPLGMRGEKKLQDFMVDEKIPREERDRVLILEANGEIVWVVGHRVDDRFKVTEATQRVLHAMLF